MKLDKNYKVRVNPKQSRKIQELVFGLGGKWNGGTDWVINEIIPFLYVTSGLVMTCDSKAQEYFGYASSENTEIQADDLIALLTDLSKSAENPLQDAELTPEFEAVEPTFKVGDKVYKYGETDVKTVLEVFEDGHMRISNYPHRVNHEVICHATPENHAMLSKPYPHIEFEQPPKPLTGSDLARAMLDKGWKYVPCYISDSSDTHALERQTRNAAVIIGTHKDHPSFFIYGSGKSFIYHAVPFDPRTGEPLTQAVLDE